MFDFQSRIRYSEVDYRGQLNVYGIVNYLQDCSTFQSEDLGVGVETLHNRNLVWVLANWNIEISRYPKIGETVSIGTFPYFFKGCFGRRNFFIKDSNGEMIVKADSLWTLINFETGEIVTDAADILAMYEKEEKLSMEYFNGRIRIPTDLEEKRSIKTVYTHIDMNNHVNNGRFVEMVMNDIPVENYKRLRVEYRKQVKEETVLTLLMKQEDDRIVCVLRNEDGENCNVLEFSR